MTQDFSPKMRNPSKPCLDKGGVRGVGLHDDAGARELLDGRQGRRLGQRLLGLQRRLPAHGIDGV